MNSTSDDDVAEFERLAERAPPITLATMAVILEVLGALEKE